MVSKRKHKGGNNKNHRKPLTHLATKNSEEKAFAKPKLNPNAKPFKPTNNKRVRIAGLSILHP